MNLEEYFERLYRLAEREKYLKAQERHDRLGHSPNA